MSWLLHLYETYKSNLEHVGKIEKKHNDQEYTLLPISHTTQTAHIQLDITEDGRYHSAIVIDKSDASTLLPCTEKSASRAGAVVAPYPLHDKLSYVAGDFVAYGGEVKKGEDPFAAYISKLGQWAESPYAVPKVKSIYSYLAKGCLIQDLVEDKVLYTDEDGRLITKWDKDSEARYGPKPPIYSVMVGGPESIFIRFNVYSQNPLSNDVWKDKEMHESFIQYYRQQLGEIDYCYVTGELLPSTDKHANKIRHAGDKAKLISANDDTGFTFRGRFNKGFEVASISYDVSQKAHNALKWLINRQGKIIDGRVFLVWANTELDLPGLTEESFDIFPSVAKVRDTIPFTYREFANEVAKALDGYKNRLSIPTKSDVNIMILDSATTGRMAVLYYRSLNKEFYLDRLVKWHSSCAWLHRYRKDEEGNFVKFYGAPATKDIAFAAYGSRAGDKVVKGLIERMFPCIVDDQKVPRDIEMSAFHRASNPVAMENWEWEKTLSITCSLINRREKLNVALDYDNNDRNYLFGRLLAVADVLERRALGPDENRASNAIRFMNAFSNHPERTWKTIQQCLQPYQARLGRKATDLNKIIDEVGSRLPIDEFNNKPLTGLYLLGYYSQRHELYQKKDKDEAVIEETIN
ncbi:type I-C CRISPR-associated protein Cas8c/Csd1 [Paenibacillus sp. GSMTC-2017]|uniref:type I-C CRISPR-associated protein Cas8c/Csd1 n=1 Tax=Paenibacillus sp. GSMTC-2017 TaxID=2794350 RepID=UPI0018D6F1CC|nr:type I-C CRISPR-associated protein Cas8c/Csd1 [Paenibacillus sp. GSMTC-2017]MBH5316964.1 type I-C CRISPR-associated protein Cas8c/Csd1 [Paenibacillus sp. GSMTC-2017]